MLENCKVEKTKAFQCIQQMGNIFLNAQQMLAQLGECKV
jgi:hypothetical protein